MTLPKDKNRSRGIDRLEKWIASNPEIPRFRQRANKTAISREVGIARSTADANPKIREVLDALAVPHIPPMVPAASAGATPGDALSPSHEWWRQTEANSNPLVLHHLLKTGRVVR